MRVVHTFYCSFCGKSQNEVARLIAGPMVFICNECTDMCQDIVHKDDPLGEVGFGKPDEP